MKQKSFVLEMKGFFSYMMCACVRKSVMAPDIGMTCEHSCRNAYIVAQCVCND